MPTCPEPGERKSKKKSARKKKILGYSFLILILAILLISMALNISNPKDYVIVVDAGSSGTRLYVYDYDRSESGALVIASAFEEQKIIPGLSEYSSKLDEIPKYLKPFKDLRKGLVKDLSLKAMSRLIGVMQLSSSTFSGT